MDDVRAGPSAPPLIRSGLVMISYFALSAWGRRLSGTPLDCLVATLILTVVACFAIHESCATEGAHSLRCLLYVFGLQEQPVK